MRAMKTTHRHSGATFFAEIALLGALVGFGEAANGGSPQLDELNQPYASVPVDARSDLVLLPALASMDAAPMSARSVIEAALLTPDDDDWPAARAWATAAPQVAALEALKTVSERRSRYVFAQPYGDAAGAEAMASGLYVDLGEPPLLARARFGYFAALDKLDALVQVEATRLGGEGAGVGAMDLLTRWLRFARSFADREYFAEKMEAFEWMRFTLLRMRDIAWLDPSSLDDVEMRAVIRSLAARELNLSRLGLPVADRLAAQELLHKTFIERNGPNPDTFGPTLAELEAGDRPLRLFALAARWREIASIHADFFDTRDEINALFNDWSLRWSVKPNDVVLEQPAEYEHLDPARFALIAAVVPDLGHLFDQRKALRVQLGGTRLALAIVGYRRWTGAWPDPVFAIRPRFIQEIPIDPWDPQEKEPYRFFVPMRDVPKSERIAPKPHVMQVGSGDTEGASDEMNSVASAIALDDRPVEARIVEAIEKAAEIRSGALQPAPQPDPQQVVGMILTGIRNMPAPLLQQVVSKQLQPLIDAGITRENAASKALGLPLSFFEQVNNVSLKQLPPGAVSPATLLKALRVAVVAYFQSPIIGPVLEKLRAGGSPAADELRSAAAEMTALSFTAIAATVQSQNETSNQSPASPDALFGALGVGPFSVSLTDQQFVLYSVGPDGQPNRANHVGPGGADVLIWPPLLSLVRNHLNGE